MESLRQLSLAILVASGLFMSAAHRAGPSADVDLETWLNRNNPRVVKYLSSLNTGDIGKVLNGVRLTDRSNPLKGFKYLRRATGLGKGIHLYILQRRAHASAFAWVDAGGSELPLPSCPEKVSFESAYVLSGDIYTWKALQPGHGVVRVMCVDSTWLSAIRTRKPTQYMPRR